MTRQKSTSSAISTRKPIAPPGSRPHDLFAAPISRRQFPGPPGAEIRRVCRTYEIKCAGKYHPVLTNNRTDTGVFSTPAWANTHIPNSAPRGERYVFELSRKVQEQAELLEDMLTTKDEKIDRLIQDKRMLEEMLENMNHTNGVVGSSFHNSASANSERGNLNEKRELGSNEQQNSDELAMMPVKLHDEQLQKVEETVAAFYRSLQGQFRAERKRVQEEHTRQLEEATASTYQHDAANDVARLQHQLNEARAQLHAQQQAHLDEMAKLQEYHSKNDRAPHTLNLNAMSSVGILDQQQPVPVVDTRSRQTSHEPFGETAQHTSTRYGEAMPVQHTSAQQRLERSMMEERERQALMSAWHNDKARANELHTENKYLRGRVTQLNALVRMMQSTL